MDDFFLPCNFANINGYSNNILHKAIEKLPSFQGNNAISAKTHLRNFNLCVSKWCNNFNHEDVKMRHFVLSLDEGALDWFTKFPANSFDSLRFVINAFNEKYGDKN